MDSENPHVFVDNTSPEIAYSGSCEASTSNADNTFRGSQHVCKSTSALDFHFYGKRLEIYGELDTSLVLQSQLDGDIYTPLPVNFEGPPSGRKGVRIFDLGALSNPHDVHLSPAAGQLVVDYLIYTPVGKTKLDGKRLIYDDTNPSFDFSGTWTPLSAFNTSALPFNGTLISTTQKSSSFSIDFVGSSVAVYGAFDRSSGQLSATFSVDGSNPEPVELINRNATTNDWLLHQTFFQHTFPDANSKTPHVLKVTVVEASESQPFLLDYILTTGNTHSSLKERQFKKTGEEAKKTGLRIGLSILGIALLLFGGFLFSKWREGRKRAKGGGTLEAIAPVRLKRWR